MRLPIQYALTHPDRRSTPVRPLSLFELRTLTFFEPDFRRFPCLDIALAAGRKGGLWPAVFNGANEVAVHAFLSGRIPFTGIGRLLSSVMKSWRGASPKNYTLPQVFDADRWARRQAEAFADRGVRASAGV
jgi:1-deoxy-D-xylulose-5-phosphate reductoisomerase